METPKVLIVEDEAPQRHIMRKWLEMEGCECVEAANGEEALERFEEHNGSIKLIVLDVMMPGMSGIELVRYMREHAISTAPVIICTGAVELDKLLHLDVFACFQKPLDRVSFVEKVGKAFYFGRKRTSIISKVKKLTHAIAASAAAAV